MQIPSWMTQCSRRFIPSTLVTSWGCRLILSSRIIRRSCLPTFFTHAQRCAENGKSVLPREDRFTFRRAWFAGGRQAVPAEGE